MNRLLAHLLLACMLCLPATAQLKDTWVVVKQNDYSGNDLFSVMTEKEFRTLNADLRREGFMATRARLAAARVWDKDDAREGRFPASLISTRRAKKMGRSYRKEPDALDQLAKVERQQEQLLDEKEKNEKRRKDLARQKPRQGGQSTGNAQSDQRLEERRKDRDEKESRRAEDRDVARDQLQADAVALYEAQMELIKNPSSK